MQNVVLDRRGPRALVKLCDFGFSVRNEADARAPVLCTRAVGTPDYMARARCKFIALAFCWTGSCVEARFGGVQGVEMWLGIRAGACGPLCRQAHRQQWQ